jgi:hypothetical protein
MSNEELIKKASKEGLSSKEADEIARGLRANTVDVYDGLLALGRAGAKQHRDLVERYLASNEDPMLARLALQVLCRYWGLAFEYRDTLRQFIEKVEWDEDDDVRIMALSCAGTLLASRADRQLLSLVFDVFRDSKQPQIVRETAYLSLAEAAGRRWSEVPSASRHFDLVQDVDTEVVAHTERTLAQGGG